jgi:hypothetical protein
VGVVREGAGPTGADRRARVGRSVAAGTVLTEVRGVETAYLDLVFAIEDLKDAEAQPRSRG